MLGIYIHVPFCAKKCPYCDFYSCGYSKKNAELFKDSVIRNIRAYPQGLDADTIYFGGGTPSLLPSEFIKEIIDAVGGHFSLYNPEITLEINPCTADEKKLSAIRSAGVNRLSVGVQSAIKSELDFLGRGHDFSAAERMVSLAANMGFENISCDMMIGLPNQTKDILDESIEKMVSLPIRHISSYILKIEENTPFYDQAVYDLIPDDDTTAELYLHLTEQLSGFGFEQYEISNYSKTGYQSRHNLKYWECEEYIGIGPSAHSYFGGKRYRAPSDLDEFICANRQSEEITDNAPGRSDERLMLGLRLSKGVYIEKFPQQRDNILKNAAMLEKAGLASLENGFFRLTPKGFLVSNSIISKLI